MAIDPHVALQRFTDALQEHLTAARGRRSENDPAVVAAFDRVAETFDSYDEALLAAYGEVTPLEVYDDSDDDSDSDEDDDSDEGDSDEDEDDDFDAEIDDSDGSDEDGSDGRSDRR